MRSYLIDEISPADMEKLEEFLRENALQSPMEGIYWMRIPSDLLNETQFLHRECQPHVFAVELGTGWIKMEFLVRTLRGVRCECQAYCTPPQRGFILNFADRLIGQLEITT